jgi:hypothetical protein
MRALPWLCLALMASVCGAEVRIAQQPDGPALIVRATARGVWTPVPGTDRAQVLNPEGDVRGDGFPAHARSGSAMLAAWMRPSTGAIVVAQFEGTTPNLTEVACPQGVGVPIPIAIPGGWALLWQILGPDTHVAGVTIQEGVVSDVVRMADGYLIEAMGTPEGAIFVSADPTLRLLVISLTPVNPLPVPRVRMQIPYEPSAQQGSDGEQLPEVCTGIVHELPTLVLRTGMRQAAVVRWTPDVEFPEYIAVPNGTCVALLRASQR